MSEQEKPKQQANAGVTPPPFRTSEEPEQTTAPSPTLAERIAAMNLDEPMAQRLTSLTKHLDNEAATDELLTTLMHGITHDEDVNNADAAGYLRGRNEKIEAVMHPQPQDDEQATTPVFPRYCRRSIWD